MLKGSIYVGDDLSAMLGECTSGGHPNRYYRSTGGGCQCGHCSMLVSIPFGRLLSDSDCS